MLHPFNGVIAEEFAVRGVGTSVGTCTVFVRVSCVWRGKQRTEKVLTTH